MGKTVNIEGPDPVLDRRAVISEILADRENLAVITGLGSPTYDVASVCDHDLNYYLWGAMGGAVSVGLGLALARPDLDVLVVTGDGEMLMGLGSLATVGAIQPGNLAILVLDNGHYGETGMQVSHTSLGCNLAEVSCACGISKSWKISTADELVSTLKALRARGSPRFLQALVCTNQHDRIMPTRDGVKNKLRFRQAIGAENSDD